VGLPPAVTHAPVLMAIDALASALAHRCLNMLPNMTTPAGGTRVPPYLASASIGTQNRCKREPSGYDAKPHWFLAHTSDPSARCGRLSRPQAGASPAGTRASQSRRSSLTTSSRSSARPRLCPPFYARVHASERGSPVAPPCSDRRADVRRITNGPPRDRCAPRPRVAESLRCGAPVH
jgi:hypothetical protein